MQLLAALLRNVAETKPNAADPRLRTRLYPLSQETVWGAVVRLVDAQQGWTVRDVRPDSGLIEVEARTRLLRFTDDITIRVRPGSGRRIAVDLTSRSRVGKGDLGTNARRIGRFLQALDAELTVPRS
jgi:uncharacterized protein (DUF1499 family)